MQKDAVDLRNEPTLVASESVVKAAMDAEIEGERNRAAAQQQMDQEETRKHEAQYRVRMKQMLNRLPEEAAVAAHTTSLNKTIRARASAGAAGGPAQQHIINILYNKLSTPSKTGCYEIKNTVWKNANIPFGTTRKYTRKCIETLIDIISTNLMYFPKGLFDGNPHVTELLRVAINRTQCSPCREEGGDGGNYKEYATVFSPIGFAEPSKTALALKGNEKKKSKKQELANIV